MFSQNHYKIIFQNRVLFESDVFDECRRFIFGYKDSRVTMNNIHTV